MKEFINYAAGIVMCICIGYYVSNKERPEVNPSPNPEAVLVLQAVESDEFLQTYILSPTCRERTKRAIEEFDKKYPKKK